MADGMHSWLTWVNYHQMNADRPVVWEMKMRYALEAARKDLRFSFGLVMGRVRWECRITGEDRDGFKLNENWASFDARWFAYLYPQYAHLIEFRDAIPDDPVKAGPMCPELA